MCCVRKFVFLKTIASLLSMIHVTCYCDPFTTVKCEQIDHYILE